MSNQVKKTKTLVIGWDAADWKFLTPLLDQGLMPNLKKLVEGGVSGKLSTLDPPLSPTLWTSIATGKRPYKHGIHGFTEPTPDGKSIRPMNITSRKCKAIWNIFTQQDIKSHVVGWWPSHPAEPINGTMVSNLYQNSKKSPVGDWPMLDGCVHPKEKEEMYKMLRVHKSEITGNHVEPLVPKLSSINQKNDQRPSSLANIISECASIHSAATYILDNEDWDFVGVYYDGIDHFCHGFMKYYPPRRPHIDPHSYDLYKDVIDGACRYHDMMLGRLVELAGEDANIILLSDHGFHPDHNRPIVVPKIAMGPAKEHSPYGIIVMNGPDFKKDALVHGASLLDITPTLLQLYGLPVGDDMDGKVLTDAFANKPKVKLIPSWEDVEGEDGSHPKDFSPNLETDKEELQQLIDLGYVEDYGDDIDEAIKKTVAENKFTLAKSYIAGNEWEEGIKILEYLVNDFPDRTHYASRLVHSYQVVGRLKDARILFDKIKESTSSLSAQLSLMESGLLFGENKPKAALQILESVKKDAGEFFDINLRIAASLNKMNRQDDALKAIDQHLTMDPESERAYFLKGRILFQLIKIDEALEAFLSSLGLEYDNPAAHFYVGECLAALGNHEDAISAYEKCLSYGAAFNSARTKIIEILVQKLNQPGRAKQYMLAFEDHIEGEIYIVSGLPRSGTSLMMQMLKAGGLEIFTDDHRKPDDNNPQGFFEHDAVKNLKKNTTFLRFASGKTVKIIANLLPYLPQRYKYKVIFMDRDLSEIMRSQKKMLVRNGKKVKEDSYSLGLAETYKASITKSKSWMDNQANVEYIEIQYSDIISSPFAEALKVNDFFDGKLAPERMASAVDSKLYRERSKITVNK